MASAVRNLFRLARAGLVLAEHGVRIAPKGAPVPLALRLARLATLPIRILRLPFTLGRNGGNGSRLAKALTRLGPSYIKLGQFLAARPDLIGQHLTDDLASLRDQLPPFPMSEAKRAIEQSLGGAIGDHFAKIEPPIAAASIAQVHPAQIDEAGGPRRVAVKILRPDVERRFAADIESFAYGAGLIERFSPPARRLRPVAVIETLKRSMDIELDLRLEGAAISEMADNIKGDPGFRVPAVDWRRTAKRVLTLEWIDGVPMGDRDRLAAEGHDLKDLGMTVLQSFLRHAMRDGFFHADMHQGNLFVEKDGTVVAVDFGIMGRLGPRERRFLAEILHGLIHRDYRRAAEVHFWAGYVPRTHSVETFAQALRAIGEPIHGRRADEISMGHLLGQLFAYTDVFDMATRTELILLQKTMVVVEGVARSLDPELNMWTAAEPLVKEWMERELGPRGRLEEAAEGLGKVGGFISEVPSLLTRAESIATALSDMGEKGLRLDDETVERIARAESRRNRWTTAALWLGALSLAALALRAFGWL